MTLNTFIIAVVFLGTSFITGAAVAYAGSFLRASKKHGVLPL